MFTCKKIAVGTKIRLLMMFLIVTLIVTSLLSFWSSHQFNGQIKDLGEVQLPGTANMGLADMMHDGIRANVYQAILVAKNNDPAEKKAVKDESVEYAANIRKYVSALSKLNLHVETKQAIVPALPRIEEYVKAAEEIVDMALAGNEESARASLPKFDEKFSALEIELGHLGELIERDVAESTAHGNIIEKKTFYYNMASLGFGAFLLFFFFMVIREQQQQIGDIIKKLHVETLHVNEIATSINSSAKNLSMATQEQANAFQQSAAALEQISATLKGTEANTRELHENSKNSFSSASHGKETIEQMLGSMNVIKDSNAMMAQQIAEGNKRISDIVAVIGEIENKTKVINDIVFQTKLLSFNASVEAARAGEQGKGFAVVAEEVGNLAQMSGNAAKEISDMLSNSIRTVESIVNDSKNKVESMARDCSTKVDQGIEIANRCGFSLEEIVHQTSSVGDLVSEITTAFKEQSAGLADVSCAMGLLDQASAQNSMTSKENLKASLELQAQVVRLEGVIQSLDSMMTSNKKVG